MKVKAVVRPYDVVGDALGYAITRACNRCDKYSDVALTANQRAQLEHELPSSFWLALEDVNVELV